MKTISALDLRAKVGQYLDEAAAGEQIIVERAGQPLCALIPLSDFEVVDRTRIRARRKAALQDIRRLARQHPLPSVDSASLIRQMREERTAQILRNVREAHERREEP